MEQKFVKFEEAVEQLGISSERLTQLRESGQLRAYRDGASWKFRADEIAKIADEGLPEPPPPSDVGLALPEDLVDAEPFENPVAEEELALADDGDESGAGSSVDLSGLDDTVTAGASDIALELGDEGSDPSDSILLSDEELGESAGTPPSTIIGKAELQAEASDLDLQLSLDDDLGSAEETKNSGGASDVLSSGIAGSGVFEQPKKSGSSAFEGLEELELDLAAESGSIVGADADQPVEAASKEVESDLQLDDDEGTDPVPSDIASSDDAAEPKGGPTSDLELATDEDDFVLAEAGGSDITLDSGDSGINLDPSDSGLALDELSLDVGGSAILSSLALDAGDMDQDIALVSEEKEESTAQAKQEEEFDLTPMDNADDEGDSSSQVIALDAELEGLDETADAGILDEDAFAEGDEGAVVLSEDYGADGGDALGVSTYPSAARVQSEYSLMSIIGLGCCVFLLLLCFVAMLDMARNIWSWNETFAVNSWLLDAVLGLFGQ